MSQRPKCCMHADSEIMAARTNEKMYRRFCDYVAESFASVTKNYLFALHPKLKTSLRESLIRKLEDGAAKIGGNHVEMRQMLMAMSGIIKRQDVTFTERMV